MKGNPGIGINNDTCPYPTNACGNCCRCHRFVRVATAGIIVLVGVIFTTATGWMSNSVLAATAGDSASKQPIVREISVLPPREMTRADLYTWTAVANPLAVLVLCPGFNGNGETLIRQPAWQEFARANQLALCAISFASPSQELQSWRGYYHAARGSGEVLLGGIRQTFGRDLPIFAYGFSGGAHFTASFVNWQPARVLGWCAYSAAWWEEPEAHPVAVPPGIVACGNEDAEHYGASLTFFAQGRALGRPWTWVSLGGTGHQWSAPLDQFVRAYFATLLRAVSSPDGVRSRLSGNVTGAASHWRDVDTKQELSVRQAMLRPTLACWLPDRSVGTLWINLHCP